MTNKSKGGGPKTDNGKAISSRNSITHGLTAKRWINDDEQDLFDATVEALTIDFDPQTSIEQILISKLAECSVRLTRIQRVEDAMFDLASSEATHPEESIRSLNHYNEQLTQVVYDASSSNVQFNVDTFAEKINLLDEIDRQNLTNISGWNYIEKNMPSIANYIVEQCINEDLNLFDFINRETNQPKNLNTVITIIGMDNLDESLPLTSNEVLKDSYKVSLFSLQEYLGKLTNNLAKDIQIQDILKDLNHRVQQMQEAAMPDTQKLSLVQRYRTADERQFSKTLGELLELQKRRNDI